MNKTTSNSRFEDLFQLSISIMLAAAVAHALNMLSTTIPEEDWWIWLISSILILFIAIIVICYILNIFKSIKQNEAENDLSKREENRRFLLNIVIISLVTLDIFAFTRYLYFLTDPNITIKISGISSNIILALTGLLGVILCIQSKYDKKYKGLLIICGIVLIIIASIIYIISTYVGRMS